MTAIVTCIKCRKILTETSVNVQGGTKSRAGIEAWMLEQGWQEYIDWSYSSHTIAYQTDLQTWVFHDPKKAMYLKLVWA